MIPDLNCLDAGTQCFPLYYYEKNEHYQMSLFETGGDEYIRRDGVTDFILNECRARYAPKVTKEDIFYYVYGLLHSPEYRERFSADLKKMLPRLPLVEKPADFWAFSKAGRELADLHLNYESAPHCPDVTVTGADVNTANAGNNYRVEKMTFVTKGDKSAIQYNPHIRVENIPLAAYDYVVNGKSAIEWIMERYQVKIDKDSQIKNDPNDWAAEHGQPRYILDLLLSVITVSLETVRVVEGLVGVGQGF
jgi:predicted helicase